MNFVKQQKSMWDLNRKMNITDEYDVSRGNTWSCVLGIGRECSICQYW